ncbi:MAG: hypothetical protein VW339_00105 [Quisquiliibacterium sp.]
MGATLLWIANATAQPQTAQIEHSGGALVGGALVGVTLDEASFEQACRDP